MYVLRIDPAFTRNLNNQMMLNYINLRDRLTPGDRGPWSGPFTQEEAISVIEERHSQEFAPKVFNSMMQAGLIVRQV